VFLDATYFKVRVGGNKSGKGARVAGRGPALRLRALPGHADEGPGCAS
jgi:hypothetical protein